MIAKSRPKTPAVFIDRDGVINVEKNYLHKVEEFEFIEGVFESLKYLQSLGYLLIIITNQSGIGRGYYTKKDFDLLTVWMINEFEKNSIKIANVYLCPHAPDENCNCRKPKTGMIEQALSDFDIDLKNSWLIGDKNSDIECAHNANIANTIHVRSGHSFDEGSSKADFIVDSIRNISAIIKT